MGNIVFCLIMEGCSALFFFLGYQLWKKEKISVMHEYHYKRVKEEDKKAYTSVMGKAVVLMGSGMAISGFTIFINDSILCGIPLAVAFLFGIGMMIYGQIKYNGGIFS